MGFNVRPNFVKTRGQHRTKCSVYWEFCMPSSNRLVSSWIHRRYDWSDAFCRWSIFFSYSIFLDDKILTQFVIYYKSRCPHNAVWNTMYYKLRRNSTQFVMYYKLRNYYKLQRNTPGRTRRICWLYWSYLFEGLIDQHPYSSIIARRSLFRENASYPLLF